MRLIFYLCVLIVLVWVFGLDYCLRLVLVFDCLLDYLVMLLLGLVLMA